MGQFDVGNHLTKLTGLLEGVGFLGVFSALCLPAELTLEHFVTQDGRILVDFPQLVQLSCLLLLFYEILCLLDELQFQRFDLFTVLCQFILLVAVLKSKHLLVDLLQLSSLL